MIDNKIVYKGNSFIVKNLELVKKYKYIIYKFSFENTPYFYSGSTKQGVDRLKQHLYSLEKNKHINTYFQKLYNNYNNMKIEIVFGTNSKNKLKRGEKEYNSNPFCVSFGNRTKLINDMFITNMII